MSPAEKGRKSEPKSTRVGAYETLYEHCFRAAATEAAFTDGICHRHVNEGSLCWECVAMGHTECPELPGWIGQLAERLSDAHWKLWKFLVEDHMAESSNPRGLLADRKEVGDASTRCLRESGLSAPQELLITKAACGEALLKLGPAPGQDPDKTPKPSTTTTPVGRDKIGQKRADTVAPIHEAPRTSFHAERCDVVKARRASSFVTADLIAGASSPEHSRLPKRSSKGIETRVEELEKRVALVEDRSKLRAPIKG